MGTPHPDDSTIPLIRLPVDIPLPISRQSSQETLRGSETTADKAPAIAPPDVYRTSIYLQEKCFLHRYIRNKDTSAIVERPERLRAVALGLAVALARLDDEATTTERVDQGSNQASTSINDGDLLARAMSQLDISKSSPTPASNHCRVVHSDASFDVVSHPAARFIHAMSEGSTVEDYPTRLRTWAQQSESKIANGESEIPEGLSQGDLYLCPGSLEAISGALGTVCQAVDEVAQTATAKDVERGSKRAFVAVRPPGHHCGEDTPSGFCFVNNVAVGAAHAYLQHSIDRVIIWDIDLHHGNGTQKIAWTVNAATHRNQLVAAATGTPKRGLKIFYGSLHDILSYPCEDGNADLVRDASVSVHGAHGQYIENVHIQTYQSDDDFHTSLYPQYQSRLFGRARAFLADTEANPSNTLIFISCGFDACEYEYDYMSRHDRKVPVSFYERFAQDARSFADDLAGGKLVSVLEGGYSDKALMSGAMAHLAGLSGSMHHPEPRIDKGGAGWKSGRQQWWSADHLARLEKHLKKPVGRKSRPSASGSGVDEQWLHRAQEIFATLDRAPAVTPSSSSSTLVVAPQRVLRERKKPTPNPTPAPSPGRSAKPVSERKVKRSPDPSDKPALPPTSRVEPKAIAKQQQHRGEVESGGRSGESVSTTRMPDKETVDHKTSPNGADGLKISSPPVAASAPPPGEDDSLRLPPPPPPLMIRIKIPRPQQPKEDDTDDGLKLRS